MVKLQFSIAWGRVSNVRTNGCEVVTTDTLWTFLECEVFEAPCTMHLRSPAGLSPNTEVTGSVGLVLKSIRNFSEIGHSLRSQANSNPISDFKIVHKL